MQRPPGKPDGLLLGRWFILKPLLLLGHFDHLFDHLAADRAALLAVYTTGQVSLIVIVVFLGILRAADLAGALHFELRPGMLGTVFAVL